GFLDCDRVTDRQRATVAIGRKDALLLELGDGRAQHDAGCGLRHLHARGLGHERRSAGGARVGLDDVEDVVLQRVLDVHQTLHADALGQLAGGFPDLFDVLLPQRHRWQRTGGVTGVDTGLLNVLHHAAEVDVLAIAESVDIDLDGGIQEAVDQDRVLVSDLRGARDVVTQAGLVVDDLHATAAEDVGRADQHRVTDVCGDLTGFLEAGGGAESRGWQLGVAQDLAELATVLGQVDGLRGGTDNWHTSVGEALRQAQSGLATELNEHDRDSAGLGFPPVGPHDVLEGQRHEVQAIGGVVVGGDGLRVAVDHHGLVANAGELEGRVDAGVVELDTLADAVRAGAQDDDLFLILLRLNLGLGVRVQLIGAVVVRGLRLELTGAGVHGLEDWVDAEGPAQGTHAVLPCELRTQGCDLAVGQAKELCITQQADVQDRRVDQLLAELHEGHELVQEPRVDAGGLIDLVHGRAEAHGELDVVEAPLGRALEVFEDGCLVGGSLAREVLIRDSPEASLLGLQRAHDLVQAGDVVAADGHGLTDGLHRGGEGVVSPWELLEGEARGLDDDIVQGRLKGGRGDLGDVVADLVERVADRQLRSELRDREAGGLGRERRGTGDARVHLDRDDPAVLGVDSELDVAATGLHADLAKNGDALVAHELELAVRQGHGRGDGDGVAGVDAQGVDVLDGCDDDYVVLRIAHQLELEFLPAEDGLLDQAVGLRGRGEAPAGDPVQV